MTTAIARIVEQFTMTLEGPAPGRDEWFLDYVLRSPKQAGLHLTAGWLAYRSLLGVYPTREFRSVHECFGGMGAQSLMIQGLFRPTEHTIGEYSWEAVTHLERVLEPYEGVQVSCADAYADSLNLHRVDLVGLDFGDLTAWKTREGEPHRKLLDRVFSAEPKAVVFTDIACRYLHLHRKRYETLLGDDTCGSYGTYLRALLARLEALYGYSLVAGYWDRWSTVMSLVPSEIAPGPGSLQETPGDPIGLELL